MTAREIAEVVSEFGLPYAYDHFAEGESPEPPFCVWLTPESDPFGADGAVYYPVSKVNIELYTDSKSPELESNIETVLSGHGIFYRKSETWIESEKLYEVLYQFETGGI